MNVGNFGTGTLTIQNGGTVNSAGGSVGFAAGSQGTVTVSDAGLHVDEHRNHRGRRSGTGTLNIQNGGTVTDLAGFVGNLPGSQGTVTVSGAGSTWTNTGTVVVGGLGTGTLTIQNGGVVNSGGGGSVGQSAGSTGTVTVTGPGSTWNNGPGGGLNIGSFGTGTLTIANGGTVNNNTAFTANIGNGAGSPGTVTVTGPGSTWSNSSGVNIGNSGHGHAHDCGRRHRYRAYCCDRGERRCDWNPQHRRGRRQSGGCTRHAHRAERRIWRRHRYAQLQSHVRQLRVCARDQRQRHRQCTRRHDDLHGANTYTGGTTISSGTLQLGNGGTSGSIIGDVTNNGIFAVNRSDAFSFGGVISGSGAFQQNGTGTTISPLPTPTADRRTSTRARCAPAR